MHIRLATTQDAAAIHAVYAQYIESTITFETPMPSIDAFTQRMYDILTDYPYLVCEQNGVIAGYAYAHRQMPQNAYQWGAELTVYLDHRFTGQGLGPILYARLIALLQLQQVHTVYALVTSDNAPSIHMHIDFGFRLIGEHRNAGFTSGAWRDVSWFEMAILPYADSPQPFRSIQTLAPDEIAITLKI